MRVFHASNTYLTLVFLAVGIDPLLPFYRASRTARRRSRVAAQ